MTEDCEIIKKMHERVKIEMPYVKIFFRPYMSAILPKGTRNIAEAKRYDLEIQPNRTTSILNSALIAGRAIFTAEAMNDERKELDAAIRRTDHLSVTLAIRAKIGFTSTIKS